MTWTLDNQQRLVVPEWETGLDCLQAGLARAWYRGTWRVRCWSWRCRSRFRTARVASASLSSASPALAWLLDYLGDAETLNHEWFSEKAA